MSSVSLPPTPPSPAKRWDEHACAYQDLMLELARIGTDIAMKLQALGGDLPLMEQSARFNEVARSVRLCALLAHKLSQPLPQPVPHPPAGGDRKPQASRPAQTPERRDAESDDKEARETEARDRLEDPLREHNLNRPVPEIVRDIKKGLGLPTGGNQTTLLQRPSQDAVSLALRLGQGTEPKLNRAARRKLAHRIRGHPSG